ncbi:hypothetical protein J2W55_003626 [Mucilaginibacter pocheonensis]|uniref:Uncharacterized protein n=1 Tax=Mucilaginibacter pocheonensis TaxID=398050 RepID=A0ABU1TED6_9SPHI|nr:hypothetical protein [Mucilaginibacter pocheonensis]
MVVFVSEKVNLVEEMMHPDRLNAYSHISLVF